MMEVWKVFGVFEGILRDHEERGYLELVRERVRSARHVLLLLYD